MTVYYSVANADLAKTLGASPNVTRTIFSESWPPTNTSAIYSNSTKNPAAGGSGLFGAIPVRYVKGETYVGSGIPNYKSYKDYKKSYTAMPNFALTDDIDESSRNMRDHGLYTSNRNGMGSVAFEALDLSGAGSIEATLQMGMLKFESGIRQMIMISQLSNAMVKIKYAGKYILSQGIRALPYEYDLAQDNGYNVNKASATIFPFALSFLLPTFVSILVQEKENRLRVMMAMVMFSLFFFSFVHLVALILTALLHIILEHAPFVHLERSQELGLLFVSLCRVHDNATDPDIDFLRRLGCHEDYSHGSNQYMALNSALPALGPRPGLFRLCDCLCLLEDPTSCDRGQLFCRALGDFDRYC